MTLTNDNQNVFIARSPIKSATSLYMYNFFQIHLAPHLPSNVHIVHTMDHLSHASSRNSSIRAGSVSGVISTCKRIPWHIFRHDENY